MSTPAQQTPEIPGGITVGRNVPIPLPAKSLEVWGLEISPRNGQVVVAIVEGEFTVKKLWMRAGRLKLMAANPTFPDIVPKDWGLHAGQTGDCLHPLLRPAGNGAGDLD